MAEGRILYAERDRVVVLRFVGDILYTTGTSAILSRSLKRFLDRLAEATQPEHVVVDLSETRTIDSTNLGLLARLVRLAKDRQASPPVLISPGADVRRLLTSMGFDRVFRIVSEVPDFARGAGLGETLPEPDDVADATAQNPGLPSVDSKATLRMILEAHRELMSLSEGNCEVFQDCVRLMEAELEG